MGASTKRARDADRDLAVEFIQEAWVDGQLTREEHDERVGRVLRAATVADIEREVTDLQGPGGFAWRPTVPPLVAPAPDPLPERRPLFPAATADEVGPTKALARLGSIGLVAVIGVVGLSSLSSGGGEAWDEGEWTPGPTSMVNLAELSAATNLAFDTTKVHSVRLRDNGRARVVVSSEESSTGAFEVVYDAELGSWLRRKEVTADGALVDLDRLQSVGPEELVDDDEMWLSTWVEPGTVDGTPTCVRTVAVKDDGVEVTRHLDCDGERID
ncbi:DUF1707 domain-containing protein [Nocardioides sp. Y6]|uniref:DUF1707 domain-containing protein n=1 Tax=Nocardioides malaquae TaxID=2773426 RepID=A0ABR9RRE5_9ACTN|nr:DUF1707 domain-containing protein [Nocardioides malaquae]MBE7324108.1 DUF1707 domain-containing protein [Nocardioides malaquae]